MSPICQLLMGAAPPHPHLKLPHPLHLRKCACLGTSLEGAGLEGRLTGTSLRAAKVGGREASLQGPHNRNYLLRCVWGDCERGGIDALSTEARGHLCSCSEQALLSGGGGLFLSCPFS